MPMFSPGRCGTGFRHAEKITDLGECEIGKIRNWNKPTNEPSLNAVEASVLLFSGSEGGDVILDRAGEEKERRLKFHTLIGKLGRAALDSLLNALNREQKAQGAGEVATDARAGRLDCRAEH